MKSLELLVERIILSSRWILVVFYLGLVAALAVYAVSFLYKFLKVAKNVFVYDDAQMILAMLGLIDAALVASPGQRQQPGHRNLRTPAPQDRCRSAANSCAACDFYWPQLLANR